jgi:hypothetical protein
LDVLVQVTQEINVGHALLRLVLDESGEELQFGAAARQSKLHHLLLRRARPKGADDLPHALRTLVLPRLQGDLRMNADAAR